MNNSLLKNLEYVKLIKERISQIKQQYIIEEQSVNINIPNEDIIINIDDQLFYETLLFEIRGHQRK